MCFRNLGNRPPDLKPTVNSCPIFSFSFLTCSTLILWFINFSDSASRTLLYVSGMFPVVPQWAHQGEGWAGFPAASATDFPTYGDGSLSHWPLAPHIFVKAVIVCPYSFCNFLYIFGFGFCDHPLIWLFLDLFIPAQSIDPIDLCVMSAFIHSFIAPHISLVSCVCLIFSSRFSSLGFQQGIYLGFLRHTFKYSALFCCVSQSSLVFGLCHE